MSRNYRHLTRPKGLFIPRWGLIGLGMVMLIWLGFKIFIPPLQTIQELHSPDGEHEARLSKITYSRDHFAVHLKQGFRWGTMFVSQPLTNSPSVDLDERIWWSDDSDVLAFRLGTNWVWGYNVEQKRALPRQALLELD